MFTIALSNVLLTLAYIVPGYMMCKAHKAVADHLSTMSSFLIYVCSPCMIVSSFIGFDYSANDLKLMALFFVVTLVMQSLFMGGLYLLLNRYYEDAKYRIITIGMVLGNVGFFGLPIVRALLPENPEVACYSSIIVVTMNILVFTMGVFCITNDKQYMTAKSALLNPSMLAFYVALPLYAFGAKRFLPAMVTNAVSLLGAMTTPICMYILGVRLATVEFKKLFTRPVVYLICAGKLIIFPLFCYLLVYFLPLPHSFKASVLILASTPCASVILNLAEIHHKEAEMSANCVLVSTLLCFMTIPVLVMLL